MPRLAVCCRRFVVLTLCMALIVSGCAEEDNPESVYLYVLNGYAGANSIDVVGPTGMIVSDLRFGERTEEPIEVDRNLGTDFTVLVDGAPQAFEADHNLFSMYPQETATFVLSQRQDMAVTSKLLRHVQGVSPACRLVVSNSLSVLSDNIGEYNAILGWDLEDRLIVGGFDQEYEEENITDWGEDDHAERAEIFDDMEAHPYFAVAEGAEDDEDEGESAGQMIWLGPEDRVDLPRVSFQQGSVLSPPNSFEYVDCVLEQEEALEALEEMQEDGDVDPEELMELEAALDMDCNTPGQFTVVMHEPGEDEVAQSYHYYPEDFEQADNEDCGMTHQFFTDFSNVFQGGAPDEETNAYEYDGYDENTRLEWETDFQISDHYYIVLFGRAIDPFIDAWRASDHVTPLPEYPGGADPAESFEVNAQEGP